MPIGRENIKDTIPAQTTSASIHVFSKMKSCIIAAPTSQIPSQWQGLHNRGVSPPGFGSQDQINVLLMLHGSHSVPAWSPSTGKNSIWCDTLQSVFYPWFSILYFFWFKLKYATTLDKKIVQDSFDPIPSSSYMWQYDCMNEYNPVFSHIVLMLQTCWSSPCFQNVNIQQDRNWPNQIPLQYSKNSREGLIVSNCVPEIQKQSQIHHGSLIDRPMK
jgi:hypothetical protein